MHRSLYMKTSDCGEKMIRKKKSASNPRKNIAHYTKKNAVFTAERYSVFAEKVIQFTENGRNILVERKKREVTAMAGSDVVQSGLPIFDDFSNICGRISAITRRMLSLQMAKRLWLILIDP
ncbi:hypothetical protein TNCV_4687901 [Trichonephila clavipes]|nr:hypothetical protein TNCV_4687901 [Trichonephila clavipes]